MVFLRRGVGVWLRPLRLLAAMLDRAWGWWFIHQLNAGYARLRRDPVAWAEELEEQRLWDKTLMDGLEDEPAWEDDEDSMSDTDGSGTR